MLESFEILIPAVSIAYAMAAYFFFRRLVDRRDREKNRFFRALTKAIESSSVTSIDDVRNIYQGVRRTVADSSLTPPHLSRWLREYLVEIIEDAPQESIEELRERKELITRLLAENEERAPYEGLPELERSIVADIEVFLDADDKGAIKRKLKEITSAVQAKEDMLAKVQTTNKWAIPLAIVGLILTVVFGILSIV